MLVNAIVAPLDAHLEDNIKQVNEWIPVIDLLASASERPDLLQKKQILLDMRDWASSRIKAALAEREANEAAKAAAAAATVPPHGVFDSLFPTEDTCQWYDCRPAISHMRTRN